MKPVEIIRLSDAQISAIECRGILDGRDDLTAEEEILRLSIQERSRLAVSVTTQPAIVTALNEMSNAEDDAAEDRDGDLEMRKFARRASKSLAALMMKVSRLEWPSNK